MMTSEQNKEAYVWIWLPKRTTPVVCGKLEADGEVVRFNYGRSYLESVRRSPARSGRQSVVVAPPISQSVFD